MVGAFSTKEKAISLLKEKCKLSESEVLFLKENYQTQGREDNFVIEKVEIDNCDFFD
ncbi:MAG: hypothetical protein ACRC0V_05725 [Fusobacteriaceae bacterium]